MKGKDFELLRKLLHTALLLLCATVATIINFEANDIYYGNGIYYKITDKTNNFVAVTHRGNSYDDYEEYSGAVTIPSFITYNEKTYKVTSIEDLAFASCSNLTSITIPNSVTSIGKGAFGDCSNLKSITIPESVTSIGEYAFYNCSSLNSITIPNSVTSIGNYAFYDCDDLTSITIPNSVTSIGNYAFAYCSSLASVTIPNSVTTIGDDAFYKCSSLKIIDVAKGNTKYDSRDNCNAIIETATNTLIADCKNTTINGTCGEKATWNFYKGVLTISGTGAMYDYAKDARAPWYDYKYKITSVVIDEGITSIGNNAFSGCGFTSITIPSSVTSIGDNAFYFCQNLASITIPESVTSIGNYAFSNCSSLTKVTIGNRNHAFSHCDSLERITAAESMTSIGDDAFALCSSLTNVTIGNSVTSIGNHAFWSCSKLANITSLIPADKLYAINSSVFNNVFKSTCTLYVPAGAKSTYAATKGWKAFKNIVEVEAPGINGSCGENATW